MPDIIKHLLMPSGKCAFAFILSAVAGTFDAVRILRWGFS